MKKVKVIYKLANSISSISRRMLSYRFIFIDEMYSIFKWVYGTNIVEQLTYLIFRQIHNEQFKNKSEMDHY